MTGQTEPPRILWEKGTHWAWPYRIHDFIVVQIQWQYCRTCEAFKKDEETVRCWRWSLFPMFLFQTWNKPGTDFVFSSPSSSLLLSLAHRTRPDGDEWLKISREHTTSYIWIKENKRKNFYYLSLSYTHLCHSSPLHSCNLCFLFIFIWFQKCLFCVWVEEPHSFHM